MNSSFWWSRSWLNMASALSSILSGVMGVCTSFISSGSSIIELICACLGVQHWAARCPSLSHLKHLRRGQCLGGVWSVCVAFPYAHCPCCLEAHAWLLVSIGTVMSFIHQGALDELTCHGAKFQKVCCYPLCWRHGGLLLKCWKSGAFCAIELTSCIDLRMAMSHFFMLLYVTGTGGVNTLSSRFQFWLNPFRKRLIVFWDARLYPTWTIRSSKLAIYSLISGYLNFSCSSWVWACSSLVESMNLSLKACSNCSHTLGTLWWTGWSLLRLSIMFQTHKLTFSPLISVRANATCQIGDLNPETLLLSMRYPRNLVRKASALVWSPSKIQGSDPIALTS